MTTPQPNSCLALCDAATNKTDFKARAFYYTDAQHALHARCRPEVVRAVYEALKGYHDLMPTPESMNALALLDGHNPEAT